MVKMQLTMTVMVIGWPIQWSHTRRSRDLSRRFPLVGCYQPSLTPPSPPLLYCQGVSHSVQREQKASERPAGNFACSLTLLSDKVIWPLCEQCAFLELLQPIFYFVPQWRDGGDCTVIGNFLTPMLIAVRFCLAGGWDRRQHTFGSHCHNV